jgi:hypothetical protein
MIPVMARTNPERWATNFAGVDAGAKMFVPFVGSLAAAKAAVDKKATITICHIAQNLDNFILRIDVSLLPFFTSEMLAITRLRTFF